MDEQHEPQFGADAAIEAVDGIVGELERVITGARYSLPDELDRAHVAAAAQKRLYNGLAFVGWTLLGELYARDAEVFATLRALEHERGEPFSATGDEISQRSGVPIGSTYAGLHRLHYLELINYAPGRGRTPGRIRLDWGKFSARDHEEAA